MTVKMMEVFFVCRRGQTGRMGTHSAQKYFCGGCRLDAHVI